MVHGVELMHELHVLCSFKDQVERMLPLYSAHEANSCRSWPDAGAGGQIRDWPFC